MNKTLTFKLLIICVPFVCTAYFFLQNKYPGKGLKVIENIFKEPMSFDTAVQALKEGHRIRRKTEKVGYTKVVIIEGTNRMEKFHTYWAFDGERLNDHCSFSIEDVFSTDWIIDDDSRGE
jgi:hypothetical protein